MPKSGGQATRTESVTDRRTLLLALAAAGLPSRSPRAQSSSIDWMWRWTANAPLIVAGVPQPGGDRSGEGSARTIEIPIMDAMVLKGVHEGPLTISHPNFGSGVIDFDQPWRFKGRRAVLFIRAFGEATPPLVNVGAVLEGDDAGIAAVRTEIALQARLLASWKRDPSDPFYRQVEALIGRIMTLKDTGSPVYEAQAEAFADLEALGEPALPAIVAWMDDRRPLPYPAISFVNKAVDRFEGMRHYGPKLMVDAMAGVLNQLTGESFGNIYSGASDAERDLAVKGWRMYAARRAAGLT